MPSSNVPARLPRPSWSLSVLAAFLLLQAGFVAWTAGSPQRHTAWDRVIASPLWPAFTDLRILANGWQENAAGFDPLRTDGDAPNYNYPRLWLLGGALGWQIDDVPWLGVLTALLFLSAAFAVMRIAPGWTRLLAVGLLASPAIGLGLERGNSDLLIFALVTPALLFVAPSNRDWRSAGAPWLVILAGMLKLFPIIALPACLIRAGRPARLSAMLGVLVFATYLIVTHQDVGLALGKTERGLEESYGLELAATKLAAGWASPAASPLTEAPGTIFASPESQRLARGTAGILVLMTLATLGLRRVRTGLFGNFENPPPVVATRLFLGGVSVFLVTFLFAHNWAYRLVFLIWTLPLLGHELYHGSWPRRVWAVAALGLMLTACWFLTAASPIPLWWAHATCFILIPVLIFIAGAVLHHSPAPESADCRVPQWIFLAIASTAGAALLAGGFAPPLAAQNFSASQATETWRLVRQGEKAAANGHIQSAIAHFEAALRLDPEHADAHAGLGAALWQAGRSAEALLHLEKAIALQPRAIRGRNTLAGIRRQQRRWDEAIAGYRESLAIRPQDVATLNQLGLACLESGRAAEARQWLVQAQKIRPDHAETARNLGIVSGALGGTDEAAGHFQQALRLKPDYADAELQWGFVLARNGRLAEALAHFQEAVKLAPESGQAHFVLAMALRELGRSAEWESHYREALRLEPSLAPR